MDKNREIVYNQKSLKEEKTKMENTYQETMFLLKKYHILANKSLGQNFLINDEVIEKTIEQAQIGEEDLVIEIGPGLG
ncbi:rRNA adenine N-6-methyltransferase family protein, partial [Faecalibacillus intestinalis]|uniref:rRNA adenine N-6-methyltransferase family protein n=1 Tax=Faecalibacillus intestinalis TaxID=1982626 RepID=UPI00399BD162